MTSPDAPADHFTFGLWTVGWTGADTWGGRTRRALDVPYVLERLAEIGASGVTFHDDDLAPFEATPAARIREVLRFKEALDATGLAVPMVTTNLAGPAVFKASRYRSSARARPRGSCKMIDPTMMTIVFLNAVWNCSWLRTRS